MNVQNNIGKTQRNEEASLKNAPSKLRAGRVKMSENERLSVNHGEERSNSVIRRSEDVDETGV